VGGRRRKWIFLVGRCARGAYASALPFNQTGCCDIQTFLIQLYLNMRSIISRLFRSPAARSAAVLLGAMALSGHAFCGEIHDAAAKGDLAKVAALLKENPDLVSSKDQDGDTPLHVAAGAGKTEVAKLLLVQKADVNARDNGGWTPLHFAAVRGQKEVAELLLTGGADVNAKGKGGDTPLHDSAGEGNIDVVALLLAHKADLEARDNEGRTPLYLAAGDGDNALAELELAKEADFAGKSNPAWIHWMNTKSTDTDLVTQLLAAKADVNARDNYGRTPLNSAELYGHSGVATLLQKNGAQE